MWHLNDILNLITALLIAWSCSLLGVFLVLRKMVMVGDAISHSVLPGIVIAYLVGSQTQSGFVMIGAAVFGVLTTIIIDFLYRKLKLQEDASIGLTFTWLFALGVLLISFFASGNVDLDQECVLFGELGLTFLDKIIINGRLYGTKSMATLLPAFLFVLVFVVRGFKGFQLSAFQAEFGKTKGINAGFWHYALMGMVSVVTVLSFESVGAILVVGFLVVPPATAYLLSNDLKRMHIISILIGTFNVIAGYLLAVQFNVSISPTIITISGIVFFLTFLFKSISFGGLKSLITPVK
jgi:manganese/zinc/iron transport system permease protein|tara:strand:+ start:17949 stop:18830 length:882 start_codon:yes stop_codon:yes gene_type:complete